MNILYDPYIYRLQKAGGINRYISEVISRLPDSLHPFVSKRLDNKIHLPKNKNLKFFWMPENLIRSSWLLNMWLRKMDVIHPSYYQITPPLTWSNIPGNVVITVYDFVMARFADRFEKSSKVITSQAAAIQRADHIICISEATQRDLLEHFPHVVSKSSVIPLASSLIVPSISSENRYQQRYFMYVGSRSFYKNFRLTLEAFALLKKYDSDLRLVVVGGGWNKIEEEQIKELGLSEAIDLIMNPEDQELVALYEHCEALLYLSEYEGFGLPPLEVMAMGRPVIALNISSLPEVVGSGGFLIEPSQASPQYVAEIAIALLESSGTERQQLSLKSHQQASLFSWERTMKETIAVYQQFQ